MNARRLLAVLVLVSGPAWFTLAAPAGGPRPAGAPKGEPAKGPKKPLAETAPRPAPVPPPDPAALDSAVRRGVDFLVRCQNKDGSWGSPALKGGVAIYTPVPGGFQAYQCAVTAMCISALIETGGDRADARKAGRGGEKYLIQFLPKPRPRSPHVLYNIWSHIYGVQALVRMHERLPDPERRKKLAELIRGQIGFLVRYESVDKGWGYYDFRIGSKR